VTDRELLKELIRVRFRLMWINNVLMSEGRPNHVLLMAQGLVDDQLREMTTPAE
jgi:hypothetical protein